MTPPNLPPISEDRLKSILEELLAQPTAPFHEDAVAAAIERLLATAPHVSVERDSFGNLIARYQRGHHPARFALAAHMDHPAWVLAPASTEGEEEWVFLGGVPKEYRHAPRLPLMAGGRPPASPADNAAVAFAVWELPAFEWQGDRLYARACDDLVGCAAIIAAFLELEASGAECSCLGLFTRAEEVGFIGAMELARSGRIARDVTILSLETSAERPPVEMGKGVILRVGDRTSLFDPATTAELAAIATREEIPFQRALMTGGTCESTAYALYGYRCGALCVALGNYHNCGPEEQIAPEYVSFRDTIGLTRLCTAIARQTLAPTPSATETLRQRLEENREKHRRFYRSLPDPVP